MPLLYLPNEILIQVAHNLDPQSFTNFLLTNHFFSTLLTPLLHNLAFEDKPSNLLWACKRGHEALARLLLNSGTPTDVRSPTQGRQPLHEASDYGHAPIVTLLLHHSAQNSAKDDDGSTPLHYAASSGHPRIVRALLQHSAECINSKMDYYNFTPLLWAIKGAEHGYSRQLEREKPECTWEHYWVVEGFVDDYFDQHEQLYFRKDMMVRLLDVVKILLEFGADIHARDRYGGSVLHLAASLVGFEVEEVVRLLVDSGADINAVDDENTTPADLARMNGLEGVAELLTRMSGMTGGETEILGSPVNP